MNSSFDFAFFDFFLFEFNLETKKIKEIQSRGDQPPKCDQQSIFTFEKEMIVFGSAPSNSSLLTFNFITSTWKRIKIEFDEETFDSPQFYMLAKSQKLLDFGTEKVVWILTESKKIFVIIPGKEWKIVDFDTDIPILDDCVLNLAKLLEEEGVEY